MNFNWWEDFFYHPIYRFLDGYVFIAHRWVYWGWQKLTRGFSDRAMWSLDHTCTDFILPRLKAFRYSKLNGTPMLDGYEHEQSDLDFKKMTREWEEILDKMILAFEYHQKVGADIDFGLVDYEITDGKSFAIQTDEEQYKKGREEEQRREEIMIEGFALFAKYYQSLWD
tara:strand:+ start:162 stop:668 length:507 start_codon:yes stop_codon:yes gene_type:complete